MTLLVIKKEWYTLVYPWRFISSHSILNQLPRIFEFNKRETKSIKNGIFEVNKETKKRMSTTIFANRHSINLSLLIFFLYDALLTKDCYCIFIIAITISIIYHSKETIFNTLICYFTNRHFHGTCNS